jgi:hypothetical protein
MTTTTTKKCEYCDKVGLPIIPLRYGVASIGTDAPKTTVPKITLGDKAAHYTYRLVRSGYVYLFDQKRDTWECYFVTPESHFFKIDYRPGVTPVLPSKPFDCADDAHRAVASCIMIPNAKAATKVWIGFSDVRWTEAVLAKHNDAKYRERHMRVIDVQSGIAGPDAQHMFSIKEIDDKVAEYQMSDSKLKTAFAWSPQVVSPRKAHAVKLIEECERLKPGKGLAVTLADPVGIAQDLAMLMHRNYRLFVDNTAFKHKLATHGVIAQMQAAIKDQAQRNEIKAGEELADDYLYQPDIGMLSSSYADKKSKQADKMRVSTVAELDRAAATEWSKYKKKYKFQHADNWKTEFDKQLSIYDQDFIGPLAKAHADWMQRESMANYFECNYDSKDISNGAVYTAVFNQCINSTGDKKACHDLYEKWLTASIDDRKNLLLGAAVFNNDELRAQVKAAAAGSVSWAGMPWDKVIESHDKATAKLMQGQADELGRMIGLVCGPVASALRKATETKKVFEGLVALGIATKHPIVEVNITGTTKAFRTALIREILEVGGLDIKVVGQRKMNQAIEAELNRQRIIGVDLEGSTSKRWLVMVDPAEVRGMPVNLKPQEQAKWLAKTIRTPDHIDQLNLGNHRARVAKWSNGGRGALPLAFGMLGIVANAVAFNSMLEDSAKQLKHTKNESLTRIVLQGAQLTAAIAGTIDVALSKLSAFTSRVAAGFMSGAKRFLGFVGRYVGAAGSMFMAFVDLWRANQERMDGDYFGMTAYLVSGVLGIAATVFLFIGWTGWGLIVVALAIVWAFVMNLLVDNKLQDWLERCAFGIFDESRHYKSLEDEMSELKAATS